MLRNVKLIKLARSELAQEQGASALGGFADLKYLAWFPRHFYIKIPDFLEKSGI